MGKHERAGEGPDAQCDRAPPQIEPALEAFATRLTLHVRQHRNTSLEVHEQGVLDGWRPEGAAVLAGVVSAATTGADPQARP